MSFVSVKHEKLLVEAVLKKNESLFAHILNELKVQPDSKLENFEGLSIFEKVLKTPKSGRFIKICLENGADFFQKNPQGIFPIHFAIESLCPENLRALITEANETIDASEVQKLNSSIFDGIINEKLQNGKNYLHQLIENLNRENFDDVSEMLKLMCMSGCSTNSPNKQKQTPTQQLLIKLDSLNEPHDLADFFRSDGNSQPTSLTYKNVNRSLVKDSKLVNMDFMMKKVYEWNEIEFVKNFEIFKTRSLNLQCDMSILLEEASSRNLNAVVELLIENNVNVNGGNVQSKFNMRPAFLACTFGYHRVLKTLLDDPRLEFKDEKSCRTLLHQVFQCDNISTSDRQLCFDLIITDPRCTNEIINFADAEDRVPLFLACFYGKNEMVKELLRHGAYIGHESVTNNIDANTLRDFLDESVKTSGGIEEKSCEVYIDYKFLNPASQGNPEMKALSLIGENSQLQGLISHPVLLSFILLKWRKIDAIVYFNLFCYFCFMLVLGFFIVGFYKSYDVDAIHCNNTRTKHLELFDGTDVLYNEPSCINKTEFENATKALNDKIKDQLCSSSCLDDDQEFISFLENFIDDYKDELKIVYRKKLKLYDEYRREDLFKIPSRHRFDENAISFWFCTTGLFLLLIYEVMQVFSSPRKYLFKPSNWLDMGLIFLSLFVLIANVDIGADNFKQICAVMILLMAAQSIELIGKVPAFSLSLHMAILWKVFKTFVKTVAPYLIIIIAFGMSFYALHFDIESATIVKKENAEIASLKRSQNDNFYKFDRYLKESDGDLMDLKKNLESIIEQEKVNKAQFKFIENNIVALLKKNAEKSLNVSDSDEIYDEYSGKNDPLSEDEYDNLEENRKDSNSRFSGREELEDENEEQDAEQEEAEDIQRNSEVFKGLEENFEKLKIKLSLKKKRENNGDDDDDDDDEIQEEEKVSTGWSNLFLAVITTVRMMLSDFGSVDISEDDYFKGYIFLVFMIFISIVLFNLLNALAISDTQEMMQVAEFVDMKKRISTLKTYEKLLNFFRITMLDLFPEITRVMIHPNKSKIVKVPRGYTESRHVKISVAKAKKVKSFEDLMTENWSIGKFWSCGSKPVEFESKFIAKVIDLLRERDLVAVRTEQEKKLKDLHEVNKCLEERLARIESLMTEQLRNQPKYFSHV